MRKSTIGYLKLGELIQIYILGVAGDTSGINKTTGVRIIRHSASGNSCLTGFIREWF